MIARLLTALFLLAAVPANASNDLTEARKLLAEASRALEDVGKDPRGARLAALGKAIRAQEAALLAYRAGLRRLARAEREATAALSAEDERFSMLLTAMMALSRAPPSASFALPEGPVTAARTAEIIRRVLTPVEAEWSGFAERAAQMQSLRVSQEVARLEATETLKSLQELRGQTSTALGRRRPLMPERDTYRRLAARAAAEAETLGRLTQELGSLSPPRRADGFESAKGTLPWPVIGTLSAGFDDADRQGRKGQGWRIAAPGYAAVTAPVDASLRYAGPLADYGQVVVLEPDAGWLLVIAGLGRIDRQIGETVLAGERLGDMGADLPESEDFLLEAAGQQGQIKDKVMYLELRRAGKPVDPALWFRADRK
ncbi:MAG: peptidoglycan DD-metalloendopeptidase family protein [Pseudomonadota bacterium]